MESLIPSHQGGYDMGNTRKSEKNAMIRLFSQVAAGQPDDVWDGEVCNAINQKAD